MADPVLNEKLILADLDRVASTDSAAQIKNGVKCALIDTFDRRPNREPFVEIINEGCTLQANLSRLEFVVHVRKVFSGGRLTADLLDQTVAALVQSCEDRRQSMLKKFTPVTEMRYSTDPVH